MLPFREIAIEDKGAIEEKFNLEPARMTERCFTDAFIWRCRYRTLFAIQGDFLFMLSMGEEAEVLTYLFPLGKGDRRLALDAIAQDAAQRGKPYRILACSPEQKAEVEALLPGRYAFTEDRDNFDYIYLAEKLATFSGKKLHGKRNFCNRFEKEHSWEFKPLTRELFPVCMEMLGFWQREFDVPPDGLEDEHGAIIRAFMRWDALGLEGGVLFAEGRCVGFTVGEKISSDTFDVHFEKAYASVPGAYPMVCREFAKQILTPHPEIVYLNREDDMGHENLRSAKLEYHPEFLLRKYTAQVTSRERV